MIDAPPTLPEMATTISFTESGVKQNPRVRWSFGSGVTTASVGQTCYYDVRATLGSERPGVVERIDWNNRESEILQAATDFLSYDDAHR